jgi:hypothetical protein
MVDGLEAGGFDQGFATGRHWWKLKNAKHMLALRV